ncbi:MAG TPA: outer membrane protein assembly factor BamE [Bryobacteraceae bacterium]|jgi:hypothetical protein
MFRNFTLCSVWLAVPLAAMAQAHDPRVDALTTEVSQLKRTVADQEQRIAQLETAVKTLQAIANPLPERIPNPTPAWHSASNWNLIKPGMSAEQVIQILGPPTLDNTVTDTRTLSYQPSPNSATTLKGTVTLMDDRVIAMVPPAF